MIGTKLASYQKRELRVCFKKNLESITYANRTIPGPFKSGKSYILPLDIAMFLIKEGTASIAPGSMSIDKVLREFSSDFEMYFDRHKVLDYIKVNSASFWTEILGKNICPYCKKAIRPTCKEPNPNLKGIRKERFFIEFHCDCKKPYWKPFVRSQYPNWVISSVIHNFFQGKLLHQVCLSLKAESTNRYLDFYNLLIGDSALSLYEKEKIPSKNTVKRILAETSKKLVKFNLFMILLMGGLYCRKLFVDDAFAPNVWTAEDRKKWDETPEGQRGKLKLKRFYYVILSVDKDTRFTLSAHVARYRNKLNFMEAFDRTMSVLKEKPEIVMGDKLAAMCKAAEIILPEDEVIHIFEDLEPWEKDELNLVERRIRDFRKTLIKRRKSRSFEVLEQLVTIAMIGLNYLVPMPEALKGNITPAQEMGIPYPFDSEKGKPCQFSWNWRVFMIWVDWVYDHATEILNAGLK